MAIHIDMAEVKRRHAETDARLREDAEASGVLGVSARCNLALMTAFGTWLAEEINRDTDPVMVDNALAGAIANMAVSQARSTSQDDAGATESVAQVLGVALSLALGLIGGTVAVRIPDIKIMPTPSGHA